jgi:rhamnosyltransferase subunit B
MADIVVTSIGSLGDLFPLLPLARELEHRGHRCRLALPPTLALAVRPMGFEVRPVGPLIGTRSARQHQDILAGRGGGDGAWKAVWRHVALPALRPTVEAMLPMVRDADLVVTGSWQLAAPTVAEKCGVPWVTAHLFPTMIPSESVGPFGREGGGDEAWRAVVDDLAAEFDAPINELRVELGLEPRFDHLVRGCLSPDATLVLADERLFTPRPDWPTTVRQVGYPLWVEDLPIALDDEAAAFLAAEPRPVLFYLGTAVALAPEGFWDAALTTIRATGRRGILLTSSKLTDVDAGDDVLVRQYLPLHRVLPHVEAFVHCGTHGAANAALRFGAPSLVVPRAWDQFLNAQRLVELGAGRTIDWADIAAERFALELDALSGEPVRDAAAALAATVAAEDPVATAVDEIERVLASSPRSSTPAATPVAVGD